MKANIVLALVFFAAVFTIVKAGDPTPQPNLYLDAAPDLAKLTGIDLKVNDKVSIDDEVVAYVVYAKEGMAILANADFSKVPSGSYAVVRYADGILWIEFADPPEAPEPPILRCPPVC